MLCLQLKCCSSTWLPIHNNLICPSYEGLINIVVVVILLLGSTTPDGLCPGVLLGVHDRLGTFLVTSSECILQSCNNHILVCSHKSSFYAYRRVSGILFRRWLGPPLIWTAVGKLDVQPSNARYSATRF